MHATVKRAECHTKLQTTAVYAANKRTFSIHRSCTAGQEWYGCPPVYVTQEMQMLQMRPEFADQHPASWAGMVSDVHRTHEFCHDRNRQRLYDDGCNRKTGGLPDESMDSGSSRNDLTGTFHV
jgi:hypothetical protein